MLFSVQHDPNDIAAIARDCFYSGQPLPEFIRNEPELLPGLEIYLEAFWDLSTCRQMGMGLGPIPWTALHEYAIINSESTEFYEDLVFHVRRLDSAYLNWISESSKAKEKAK